MTPHVENIYAPAEADGSDGILAMIVRNLSGSSPEGVRFYTPRAAEQQVGYIRYPAGHVIEPHVHQSRPRTILHVPEVLLIRKGRVLVDFYTSRQQWVCERLLKPEDVLMLFCGGHGFSMLNDAEIYEVRQGPYLGDEDKIRFKLKGK